MTDQVDPFAARAEVWGLWHGYTSNAQGIYYKRAYVCKTWIMIWARYQADIQAWEAAGGAAYEAQIYLQEMIGESSPH